MYSGTSNSKIYQKEPRYSKQILPVPLLIVISSSNVCGKGLSELMPVIWLKRKAVRRWGKLGYRSIGDSTPVSLLKQLLDPIDELSFQQRFITDHPGAMQKTLSIAFETTLYSPRHKSTRRITQSFICISQEPNDKLWKRGFAIARSDSPLFFCTQFSM